MQNAERAFESERIVRSVLLRWQSSGNEVRRGLAMKCVLLQYLLHVCVYYCSTYYKAVREGGRMEDMCYERLRAEAGVN